MRSPKAKLGTLLLLLLFSFSLAHPQSPQSDLSDYDNLARQAVADWLKGQTSFEMVGPLVVPGDHASLHRRSVPVGRSLRPFVLVAENDEPGHGVGYLQVEFEASGPQVLMESSGVSGADLAEELYHTSRQILEKLAPPVFTMSERRQITSELAAFWDAWLDVARGPERLAPLLADEVACVVYNSGERDSSLMDAGSCSSILLRMLEGLAFEAWCDIESGCDSVDTEEELALIRNEWREAGLFDPQHLALVRPYLGRHLKEGLIWKVPASVLKAVDEGGLENGSPDPFLDFLESECGNLATQEEEISCFNTWLSGLHGDVHYGVSVFEEGLLLFFGRKGTSLRLVGVFSGSG